MSEVNLFTYLDQIQSKRRKHPYDKKLASAYMLLQWLSHDKDLIERVNKINEYLFLLPDETVYEYLMDVIPTGKRYIKWVKKRKKEEVIESRINKLQELYPKMSKRECKMVITSLMKNVKGEK